MALIRKKTLKQLKHIHDLLPNDIGEITSKDTPEHIDRESDRDMPYEKSYDQSNEIVGSYGCGNFGEMWGDMTNNGKMANVISIHNPLDKKTFLQPYEDMHHMHGFGDYWFFRNPKKVQKFDQKDEEIFEKYKIQRFNNFKKL